MFSLTEMQPPHAGTQRTALKESCETAQLCICVWVKETNKERATVTNISFELDIQ